MKTRAPSNANWFGQLISALVWFFFLSISCVVLTTPTAMMMMSRARNEENENTGKKSAVRFRQTRMKSNKMKKSESGMCVRTNGRRFFTSTDFACVLVVKVMRQKWCTDGLWTQNNNNSCSVQRSLIYAWQIQSLRSFCFIYHSVLTHSRFSVQCTDITFQIPYIVQRHLAGFSFSFSLPLLFAFTPSIDIYFIKTCINLVAIFNRDRAKICFDRFVQQKDGPTPLHAAH